MGSTRIPDSLVEWARSTALHVHAGQTYGEQSYFVGHLQVVARLIEDAWKPRPTPALILAAAYLHDALEDTDLCADDIAVMSPHLAQIVLRLTRPPGTRRETEEAYLKQVRLSRIARQIKLADRLANVLAAPGSRFAPMYLRERDQFQALLRRADESSATFWLWARLDDAYERLEHDF